MIVSKLPKRNLDTQITIMDTNILHWWENNICGLKRFIKSKRWKYERDYENLSDLFSSVLSHKKS